MKFAFQKTIIATVVLSFSLSANAVALSGALDGMFVNATAPSVIDSQFRGAVTGGSLYVRSPLQGLRPFAIDPPRIDAGCGGIDLYLGSFSFITAAKLTAFIRAIAQNAAPLAFKLALDSQFPQLGNALNKFQDMAQKMNDNMMNSCQMAHGLVDGTKGSPAAIAGRLTDTISTAYNSAKGWVDGFFDGTSKAQEEPSGQLKKVEAEKATDGTPDEKALGNLTWNALKAREVVAPLLGIADGDDTSRMLVMSLLGTEVRTAATSDTAKPKVETFPPILLLKDFIDPPTDKNGTQGLNMYQCGGSAEALLTCKNPSPDLLATTGIKGYVRRFMYGSDTATVAMPGSIVGNVIECNSGDCGLTIAQKKFLNTLGNVPVIGLLTRAQQDPNTMAAIAPALIDEMVNEVGAIYGRALFDVTVTTFSGGKIPRPESYDSAIKIMSEDLRYLYNKQSENLKGMKVIVDHIDAANRSLGKAVFMSP